MGQRLGSLIGAIGGVLFVLLNAGPLGRAAETVVQGLGVVAFTSVLIYAVVRTRGLSGDPPPPRSALRTYAICVVAMVVAIPLGTQLIVRVLHRPELALDWVVFVVGVHFLPFARAFRVPLFGYLAAGLIVVALVGGGVALAAGPVATAWAAVAAGFLLLGFAAAGGLRARQRASVPPSGR